MFARENAFTHGCAFTIVLLMAAATVIAGYKARPWSPRPAESYRAKLMSEGITIAVEPLYRDDLAAQIFDKNDMISCGILPLAVVVFNDNNYPVRLEASTMELIEGDDHLHTLVPGEVVPRLFKKGKNVWIPNIPRVPSGQGGKAINPDALDDFEHKFLGSKTVPAHGKAGGFLFLHPWVSNDLAGYLARARLYIPDVYRADNESKLIFFEIDLKPAMDDSPPAK